MDLVRTLGVAIDPSGAKAGGAAASAAFRDVGNAAKGTESSVKSLQGSLNFLRNVVAVIGLGSLVRELYQTDTAMARLQNQLKVSSGSVEEFRRNFDYLRSTAERLGLDLKQTGDSFGQFVASAKGKLSGSQIRESFTAISEASTAMGLSAEQTSQTIVALSQMLSKGTVASQELKMQLGNALPGAFQLAAKAMGLTEKEMNKALDTGTIMADDLVPRLAKALHEAFGQQALEGAKGLQAEMNRLKTAWTELQMVFMSEGGETLFSRAIRGAKEAIQDFKGWLAGLFEAKQEGQLSEYVAASLRVGFGKAANYFGGFVKTAGEMLSAAGKTLFTGDYFKNLLGAFSSVAAGFGLALLEALNKPLAYLQAAIESFFDPKGLSAKVDTLEQARKDVLKNDPRFAGLSFNDVNGRFGALFLNDEERKRRDQYTSAVDSRQAELLKASNYQSVSQRASRIMAEGGPRFGFSGDGQTVAELKQANDANIQYFTGELAKGTAIAVNDALGAMKNFKPMNAVDTSADESLLKGFSLRSPNKWGMKPDGSAGVDFTKLPPKSIWTEMKRGIDEASAALMNLNQNAFVVGTQAVDALADGFNGFFGDIIDGADLTMKKFREMTASILRDIAKIISQQMVARPIAGAIMSAASSAFAGMFGGAGAGATDAYDTGNLSSFGSHHIGGFIGLTPGIQRLANPAIFANAPRFHTGLRPDEFPAILQRGEEVVPKNEVGRSGVMLSMPITVHVDGGKGGNPEDNRRLGADIARQIQGMVDERIARAVMPRGILSSARA